MKTKGSKTLKSKRSDVGVKETRAKLPQYKAKKKQIKKKQGSFLKCLKMRSPRRIRKVEGVPDVPSPSFLKLTCDRKVKTSLTPKRRKKKISERQQTEETDVTTTDSINIPLDSNIESVEVESTSSKYEAKSGQRNLGAPVVVEVLSTSLNNLNIPKSMQELPKLISMNMKHEIVSFKGDKNNEESCVLTPESTNYSYHTSQNENRRRSKNIQKAQSPKKLYPKRQLNRDRQQNNTEVEISINNNTMIDLNESTNNNNEDLPESTLETEVLTEQRRTQSHGISVENAPRLYCVRNKVIVIMKKNCRFCFNGKLRLKVIHGSVQVYGCVITRKSGTKEIYSPRGYSSIAIQTHSELQEQNDTMNIWPVLLEEGIHNDAKSRLVDDNNQLEAGTAVILLSNIENKLTKFLRAFYSFRLFPKIRNVQYSSWTNSKRAEVILQSNLYFGDFSCKDLIFDPRLADEVPEKILNQWRANEWSCALVAGGKSVGKSTTTRYLINTLLRTSGKVILLDLDPGQAECTPAACISYSVIEEPLLGPNFTHLKLPVYQIFLGDVNVSRCITRYIEGMKMLVDKLTNCPVLSRLPIIVNTMGFTQGLGWDIIIFTLKLIRPSLVVQIMSERPRNNFPDLLNRKVTDEQQFKWANWCSNVVDWNRPCTHEICVMYSQAERKHVPGTEGWNMEPYQQRELVMISYFSQMMENVQESTSGYNDILTGINQVVPYATPFSSLSISIPDACVPPSHALTVVNGNIVALCGIDVQNDETNISSTETESSTSSPKLLTRTPLCPCYGFGIVRGVDMATKEVFINTPLPASTMQHVNCLVGCIQIPISLLQLNYFKNVPYTGGSDILPTSREPRRGYFRMRYHNTQHTS